MERPIKLLPNSVDQDSVPSVWKLIDALGPQRHGKANQQDGFNQNNREFQVRGNSAGYTIVIGHGMATAMITNEALQKKGYPTDKERAHEPMAKLDDVIDLVAVLGRVGRHTEQFVNQGKPTHIATNLPRSIARTVPADGGRNARDES